MGVAVVEFDRLLDDAALILGMDNGLRAADGHLHLRAGADIDIHVQLDEDAEALLQTGVIGKYRRFGDAALAAVLAANRPDRAFAGFTVGGMVESGFYALSARHALGTLDGEAFCAGLDAGSKAVAAWRGWFERLDMRDRQDEPCPIEESDDCADPAPAPAGALERARRLLDEDGVPYREPREGRLELVFEETTLGLEQAPEGVLVDAGIPIGGDEVDIAALCNRMLADNLFFMGTNGNAVWLDGEKAPRVGCLAPAGAPDPEALRRALCAVIQDARVLGPAYRDCAGVRDAQPRFDLA